MSNRDCSKCIYSFGGNGKMCMVGTPTKSEQCIMEFINKKPVKVKTAKEEVYDFCKVLENVIKIKKGQRKNVKLNYVS